MPVYVSGHLRNAHVINRYPATDSCAAKACAVLYGVKMGDGSSAEVETGSSRSFRARAGGSERTHPPSVSLSLSHTASAAQSWMLHPLLPHFLSHILVLFPFPHPILVWSEEAGPHQTKIFILPSILFA